MSQKGKLLEKILRGTSDANIPFEQLRQLLIALHFEERVRGDHHIFTRDDIEEILNIQPKGDMAKPYQARQVRGILLRYKLGGSDV